MINGQTVAVVIPCRNEERAIGGILETMPEEIDEVIVVDNDSSDRTAAVAEAHRATVVREPRKGYGYALRTGIALAKSDIIVLLDGDGTYPHQLILPLLAEMLGRELDFASCTRMPRREKDKKLWIRISGVVILNVAIRILYGFPIRDCLSGMMIMRRAFFANRTFEEGDWNFNVELKLAALVDPSIRFAEIHIPYHDRVLEQSKQHIFLTGFKHLWYVARFRFTRAPQFLRAFAAARPLSALPAERGDEE